MITPLRRNRDFHLYWSGQLMSVVGTRIGFVARPLLVLAVKGSPAAAGVASFAFTLPFVLAMLPAGAILDRTNRKGLMVACDAIRCLAAGAIAVAAWRGSLTFGLIVVTMVVTGLAYPFFIVGERASIPQLVQRPQLSAAMAQVSAREYTGLVVGQSLGGEPRSERHRCERCPSRSWAGSRVGSFFWPSVLCRWLSWPRVSCCSWWARRAQSSSWRRSYS